MPQVNITADDVLELKRLRDRANKEVYAGVRNRNSMDARTEDNGREAQHALETLERILKQT